MKKVLLAEVTFRDLRKTDPRDPGSWRTMDHTIVHTVLGYSDGCCALKRSCQGIRDVGTPIYLNVLQVLFRLQTRFPHQCSLSFVELARDSSQVLRGEVRPLKQAVQRVLPAK